MGPACGVTSEVGGGVDVEESEGEGIGNGGVGEASGFTRMLVLVGAVIRGDGAGTATLVGVVLDERVVTEGREILS